MSREHSLYSLVVRASKIRHCVGTVDYSYVLAEKGREKEGEVLNEILNFGIVGLIVSLANV